MEGVYLRALFEEAPDAMIVVGPDGCIIAINRSTEELFGYERGELIGQAIEILLPARYGATHVVQRDGFLASPHKRPMGVGRDLAGRRKDGTEVPVDIMLSPVAVMDTRFVTCVVRNVTERRRVELELKERAAELKRSNEELEQFAAVASHDLQEPLRTVAASCHLIERKLGPNLTPETKEFLGYAIDGAKRMQELISDLLAFSRVGRSANFGPVDLSELVARVVKYIRPAIEEAGASVEIGPLPVVTGDPSLLSQLFQNLIGNGLKFRGAETPKVTVSAARDGDLWRIAVADNGIGIAPAFQERIFVIFQRLHNRERYPGTGIGLATCKKIVAHHKGRLWVDSSEGAGATFHFTLQSGDRP